MKTTFPLIVIILCFISCSSDKPAIPGHAETSTSKANTVAGAYALELGPKNATRTTTLSLSAKGFDLSSARIVWLVNGRPVTTDTPAQFNGAEARKGDEIQANATIDGSELASNVVQIANSLPQITRAKIMPEVFKPGDVLSVEVSGTDADDDTVSFIYEWTKNGEPAGNGEKIEGAVKRGDKLMITITPFDGEARGLPIIINKEIANMPPVIIPNAEFSFDGSVCIYQVKASDPDGDSLLFALESPPEGMTIDKASGLITWTVPEKFKGKQEVSISVSDGHGGVARDVEYITIQ